MKSIMLISFIGLVLCTAFYSPQVSVIDYRDAYVGKYSCKSSSRQFRGGGVTPAVSSDTVTVFISKDLLDSMLQVKINQQVLKVKILNKNLKSVDGNHYGGKFYATDSIFFSFQPSLAMSTRYVGKKQ